MRRLRFCSLVLLAIAVLTARASAAGFAGRVVFGDLPVPGATVTATKGDRHVTTVTDEQGAFTFADLDSGAWTVQVEMLTFVTLTRDVTIPADTPPVWSLTLKPLEELTSSRPPTAAAPSPTSIAPAARPTRTNPARPASPAPSTTTASTATSPASTSPAPAADTPPADANDGMVINGSVNNGAASPIAQSPAFGNNRRQGRSLYNGGIAAVYGDSALDSRPFAFGGTEPAKASYQNTRVTGTFGGPIKLSQSLRKDPTLFISLQHSGDSSASTQSGVVPTAAERAGDFSQATNAAGQPLLLIDPATGQPFPNNTIPGFRISPQAQALLQYFPPAPGTSGDSGFNLQAPLLTTTNQTLVTTRLTQALSTNDQLSGQIAYQHSTTGRTTLFGFTDDSGLSGTDASINWVHRAGRTMNLRLRYGFTGLTNRTTPFFANRTNVSGDAGIAGNDQSPANWGPPSLQFATITGLTDAVPVLTRDDTNSGGAEATWLHGHHNVTFGGDARRVTRHDESPSNPRGAFTFTGAATGSDFADFLLGIPTTSAIAFGNADRQFQSVGWDAYVSDDWRFSPTLTLQIGARWEFEGAPTERNDGMANLDVAPGFTAVSPVLAGNTGSLSGQSSPASVMHDDWRGLQPRLSFAWRPLPGSSFLMRGGYGIYRNTGTYLPIDELLSQQPPLSTAFTVANTPATPLSLANGFLVPSTGAANTFAVDPNLRIAESQSWQIMVQRDLWGFLTFTASYLGTRGDRSAAGISAEHISGRRGESVSLVPGRFRLSDVWRPLAPERGAVAGALATSPRSGRQRPVHARQGHRQRRGVHERESRRQRDRRELARSQRGHGPVRVRPATSSGGAGAVHDGRRSRQRRPHGRHARAALRRMDRDGAAHDGQWDAVHAGLSRAGRGHRHRRIDPAESDRRVDRAGGRVLSESGRLHDASGRTMGRRAAQFAQRSCPVQLRPRRRAHVSDDAAAHARLAD